LGLKGETPGSWKRGTTATKMGGEDKSFYFMKPKKKTYRTTPEGKRGKTPQKELVRKKKKKRIKTAERNSRGKI